VQQNDRTERTVTREVENLDLALANDRRTPGHRLTVSGVVTEQALCGQRRAFAIGELDTKLDTAGNGVDVE
jgi:hypothetical protein